MRLNRLIASLMGVAGVYAVDVPAKAAQLQSWQFDASQNRLTFTTDSSVQPQARLLSSSHQLVVDLPGIDFEQVPTNQLIGGVVRQVRLERAGHQATRLILDLNPDYAVTPQQIRVWGVTSQQWVVQLPDASQPSTFSAYLPPEIRPTAATKLPGVPAVPGVVEAKLPQFGLQQAEPSPRAEAPTETKQSETAYAAASTLLQSVVATPNGFFIQTGGAAPQVQVYRVRDRNQSRQLVVDVLNAQLASSLNSQPLPSNQYGVSAWSLTQFGTTPPAVRIILSLDANAPDWQVTPIRQGGIVILPAGATATPAAQTTAQARALTLPPINSAPPQVQAPSGRPVSNPQPLTLPPIQAPTASPTPGNRPTPQGQVVVVLDPGHGGPDPGAVGIGGLQEKLVVMAISPHTAAALQAQGISVVLTRQGDQDVDLQPRVDLAERSSATAFVSIHANAISMDRPEVNGLETYYYSDRGARFAEVLHRRAIVMTGMGDRGVRQGRFFVLRRTSMPAVLIEVGFVTGAQDAPRLADPAWQARMGHAIAQGILEYLRQGNVAFPP